MNEIEILWINNKKRSYGTPKYADRLLLANMSRVV